MIKNILNLGDAAVYCDFGDEVNKKTNSLISEIELIQLYYEIFSCLSIPNINICINNRKVLIGMVEVMNASSLFNEIVIILDKLDKIGLEEVKKEISSLGISGKSIEILDISFI